MRNIFIIGCGAWGTTLSKVVAENGHNVTLWCHDIAIAKAIAEQKENTALLPGIKLPAIATTTDLSRVNQADIIIIVTASDYFAETVKKLAPYINQKQIIVSATKGLSEKTDQRMSEILTANLPTNPYAVLSGPNISREIAEQKPSTVVIASPDKQTAEIVQNIFHNNYFRVYTNDDVIGTELGGTLKNIIAIAAGIIDGLNLGNNAKAALMVRGMAEMSKLAISLGAKAETLYGLTGMGDLITTCSSSLSRNHTVGEKLAKGQSIQEILGSMKAVAEGVSAAKVAYHLAQKKGVTMPITEQIYAIVYQNRSIPEALQGLMSRAKKAE